jgi:hypothetical protein
MSIQVNPPKHLRFRWFDYIYSKISFQIWTLCPKYLFLNCYPILKLIAIFSRDLSWNIFTRVYWSYTWSTKTSVSRDASFSALVSLIAVPCSWVSHLHEGFLFRARPTLMTLERSASIMDDIFHSSDLESHGRLLRIMHDFLVSESTKHHEDQKGLSDLLCPCAVLILYRWQ